MMSTFSNWLNPVSAWPCSERLAPVACITGLLHPPSLFGFSQFGKHWQKIKGKRVQNIYSGPVTAASSSTRAQGSCQILVSCSQVLETASLPWTFWPGDTVIRFSVIPRLKSCLHLCELSSLNSPSAPCQDPRKRWSGIRNSVQPCQPRVPVPLILN